MAAETFGMGGNWFGSQGGFNWKGAGGSMLGASGGSGGGLNGVQYFENAAVNGLDIWNTSLQSDMLSSAYKWQAKMAADAAKFQGELQSAEYRRSGDAAVKNIGIVQQKGLDQTTLRYEALGREIANQRVSAAGSGIDLSSRTGSKAEQTSRMNASWDVRHIATNTKIAADNYNAQAEAAYRNSAYATINADYTGKMAKIQGDLNADLADISGKFGMIRSAWNMGTNIAKGVADIYSGGWVSTADNMASMTGRKKGLGEV